MVARYTLQDIDRANGALVVRAVAMNAPRLRANLLRIADAVEAVASQVLP